MTISRSPSTTTCSPLLSCLPSQYGEQILLYDSTTYASDPRSSISLPFGFLLPSATRCLPSSFEGGTRPFFSFTGDMVGSKVARIHCQFASFSSFEQLGSRLLKERFRSCSGLIKLTANKRGTFAVNERKTLPFLYLSVSRLQKSALGSILERAS
jgi:hypothetical protein